MKKKLIKKIKLHVKKGDEVKILAGNFKNKTGKIIKILAKEHRAIIEGINLVTKHMKPSSKNAEGKIIQKESPIHISNLMCIDPATEQPTRIGRKYNEKAKLQRYAKKTGNFLN